MTSVSDTNTLLRMASHLGLSSDAPDISDIVDRVRSEVGEAIQDSRYDDVETLEQLRNVVCDNWSIQMEVLNADDDLDGMAERYSYVEPHQFNEMLVDCFEAREQLGAVYENPRHHAQGRHWLAVVDARGPRRFSAEFTSWHEIAHVLTGYFGGDASDAASEAAVEIDGSHSETLGERIIDRVASDLMFWDPLWEPEYGRELREQKGLTFEIIDSIRRRYAPQVSFYACAIQCVQQFHRPVLLVRIGMGMKTSTRRKWLRDKHYQQDLPEVPARQKPDEQLRLVECIAPDAPDLEDPMEIWQNMRVPESSVLREVYESDRALHRSEYTDQSNWETSKQGALPSLPLYVEAKQFGPNTLGLIQPNWHEVDLDRTNDQELLEGR